MHSFSHGRAIAYNDPEVLEQEAEARGLDSGITMEGNLFARSTWQRFTLSALDARGMRTSEEEARVADQGLLHAPCACATSAARPGTTTRTRR